MDAVVRRGTLNEGRATCLYARSTATTALLVGSVALTLCNSVAALQHGAKGVGISEDDVGGERGR